MGGLSYLFCTRIKNQIIETFKSPTKIIFVIIMAGLLILSLVSGQSAMSDMDTNEFRPVSELYALIFVLYAVMFLVTSYRGFSSGASMFSMSDVNLVFCSPFKPRKVLFYGLVQQLGQSILIGFFILFQYGWLSFTYGTTFLDIILILVGYGLSVFCGQLTAMVIYSLTSGDDYKKRIAKTILIVICAVAVLYVGFKVYEDMDNILPAAVDAANGMPMVLFPVAGWLQACIVGIMQMQLIPIVLGLAGTAIYIGLLVAVIVFARSDYYEDVLQASEVSFSAITARKEGKVGEMSPKNVKVGKTGIDKGFGANAFYFKHILENRRSKIFLLDTVSLIYIGINIAFAIFTKEIIPFFCMSTYLQMISTSMSRINRELLLPYVYLVPEPPFKKLMYCLLESLPKVIVEAVIIYIPVGILLSLNPIEIIIFIIERITFGFLFTAGNIMVERVFGQITVKGLILAIYFLMLIVLSIPGIIAAVITGVFFSVLFGGALSVYAVSFLVLAICNILVGTLVIFLCRNMLQYAELNNK